MDRPFVILHGEDDLDFAQGMIDLLQLEYVSGNFPQHEWVSAQTGSQLLALAQRLKPDLIISDHSLAEMNGAQVLTKLKQDSATQSLKFMFLTAQSRGNIPADALDLADAYLRKPFAVEDLLETIKELLNGSD